MDTKLNTKALDARNFSYIDHLLDEINGSDSSSHHRLNAPTTSRNKHTSQGPDAVNRESREATPTSDGQKDLKRGACALEEKDEGSSFDSAQWNRLFPSPPDCRDSPDGNLETGGRDSEALPSEAHQHDCSETLIGPKDGSRHARIDLELPEGKKVVCDSVSPLSPSTTDTLGGSTPPYKRTKNGPSSLQDAGEESTPQGAPKSVVPLDTMEDASADDLSPCASWAEPFQLLQSGPLSIYVNKHGEE
ncbi:uncharacterized protein EI97DRAFT_465422 [Westerdykella ornata]|uniref:Uncharacterized protein n=1 Tax=Westerdykella ornata TaxID=318751 RepID=A0A6A6JS44_WESOR|nr:uncharacterized protein EI97DRAFT_465422 [Westerdykella ornata]KAF2279084.1 hypothetical protein EI97DRAFT_465422 [Westerdykella ornata]